MKTNYVVGFLFDPRFTRVALIRKAKPKFQRGLLNGIGGKIEAGETAIIAMCREFSEETTGHYCEWKAFGSLNGTNNDGSEFSVECFFAVGNPDSLSAKEIEPIEVHQVSVIAAGNEKTLGNVPWLVALAKDFGAGVFPPVKVHADYTRGGVH